MVPSNVKRLFDAAPSEGICIHNNSWSKKRDDRAGQLDCEDQATQIDRSDLRHRPAHHGLVRHRPISRGICRGQQRDANKTPWDDAPGLTLIMAVRADNSWVLHLPTSFTVTGDLRTIANT